MDMDCHGSPRLAVAWRRFSRRDGLSLCHNDIAVGTTVGLAVVISGGFDVALAKCHRACRWDGRGDGHLPGSCPGDRHGIP